MAHIMQPTLADHSVAARILAGFLVAHGIAHFAGTTDLYDKASAGGAAEYLGGFWTVADPSTLRVLGVLWAVIGIGVILSALPVWRRNAHARQVLTVAVLASLALSVIGVWSAILGVVINLALVGLVLAPNRAALR